MTNTEPTTGNYPASEARAREDIQAQNLTAGKAPGNAQRITEAPIEKSGRVTS